jgi:catechol 2,3-dioxygenase-like lactoylglutathione lyase family enzyme
MSKTILYAVLACVIVLVAWSPVAFAQQDKPPTPEQPKNKDEKKDGATTAIPLSKAHLRIARATDHPQEIVKFYRDGLGFELMETFDDKEIGIKGWLLGHVGQGYHLEITYYPKHKAGRAPNEDSLLVFYLPDKAEWQQAVDRMMAQGYKPVKPFNPYWEWDGWGKTFEDADGYRVVLIQRDWKNYRPSKSASMTH